MFQKLVNRNSDIQRLVEKGYAVGFDGGYLIIRDIPYLNDKLELQTGAFVTKLVFEDEETVRQEDHQVFFAGSVPYGLEGAPIANLGGGATTLTLSELSQDVVVQRSFSNKPRKTGAFADFFEKIESYVAIISGPAMSKHGASPLTFRTIETVPDSVFLLHDTLTSRAEINDLSAKFKDDVIALIGLGGTGAYVLDFLIKTPVREIRGFDGDEFHVHNAFRSPGTLDYQELSKSKAAVYQSRYENFRKGLFIGAQFIDASSAAALDGVTFAFVCVDKGSARSEIFDLLISLGIPFIDVGMGLNRKHTAISGMARMTYFSPEGATALKERGLAELNETSNDEYRTNIQIGELNALNAALAVLKFKQIRGFYHQEDELNHLLFGTADLSMTREYI